MMRRDPQAVVTMLQATIESGERVERQSALSALGKLPLPAADALLTSFLDQLLAGRWLADVELELLTAASQRDNELVSARLEKFNMARNKEDPLSAYRECLAGGDAARGEQIFRERTEVACLRCHRTAPGEQSVGPNLSGIAREKSRRDMLQAMVDPNRDITQGFDSTVLLLEDGSVKTGIVKLEDDDNLHLMDAEGKTFIVVKEDIEERRRGKSAMPDDILKFLSKDDLRDLVEFLSQQK